MDQRTLLLVMAVILVNILSRFYGFWVITSFANSRKRGLYFWPALFLQLLVPIPIPPEHPILKWFLLSNTCLHVFKLIDYYHRYESLTERDKNFKRFFHSFDCAYTADIRKSFVKEVGARYRVAPAHTALKAGLIHLAIGTTFLLLNRHFGWWSALGGSPILDYSTLALEFYFLCVGLVHLGVGIHKMMGYRVEDFFNEPIRSHSPEEFWSRWNIPVHEWLRDNVYKKCGGRFHPYRSLFATFLVSGLFHEYNVSLATNTLNGCMIAYFMTQFLSVFLSLTLRHFLKEFPAYSRVRFTMPLQRVKWFLTFCRIMVPIPLFIHNLNKVFPLHAF